MSINWPDLFTKARQIAEIHKQETLAEMMGISNSQLSQQLSGMGQISLGRLVNLALGADPAGRVFVAALFDLLRAELGLQDVDPVAAAIGHVMQAMGAAMQQMKLTHLEARPVKVVSARKAGAA